MNLFGLSGLLLTITGSLMVTLMLWQGRTRTHRIWAFFCLSALFWGAGSFQISRINTIEEADLWWRITHIGVIFIPITFTHFVYEFLQIKRKYLIFCIYGLGFFFLVANFIDGLFIAHMRWVFNQFYYDSPPGPLYTPFVALFVGLIIHSHYILWKAYRTSKGIPKKQIRLFFLGMAISFAGGSLSFLPVYNIDFYPIFNLLAFIYPIIVGYTILRYRLFDIRLVVRRGTIRIILAAFTYGMFHLVTLAMVRAFGSVWARQALITGIFIAIAFVLVLPLVERGVIKLTNRYLYASIYSAQKSLRSLTRKLTTIVDVLKISALITESVHEVMDVEYATIFVQTPTNHSYRLVRAAGLENQKKIPQELEDGFFTGWIRHFKKAVVKDELSFMAMEQSEKGAEKFMKIQKYMEKIGGEVCIPFVVKRDLIGFLLIGAKTSRDAYTKEDIELLETLGNQTAIALENALLYEHMGEIVEDQTKEIKEKNIHLEKLLQMRGQFLDIASHQLRTPISVIKGYVSMLREGDYDSSTPEEKDEVYRSIAEKTEKLSQIVRDILYASELDTGKFILQDHDLTPFPIAPYVSRIVSLHEDEARAKNIALAFEPSGEDVRVCASDRYLEVVLDNLISNSLHYTPEGGIITVRIKPEKDTVRIEVEDTGIGVPPADQPGLFEKFKRGGNANSLHTDGSGLGLFIIKELIKAHPKGDVGFVSELNRGSTFWVQVERAP